MLVNYKKLIFILAVPVLVIAGALTSNSADLTPEERAELEAELAEIEEEIQETQNVLTGVRQQTQGFESERAKLDAQIKLAQLEIRKRNLSIGDLTDEITLRQDAISELEDKLSRERDSLGAIIRQTNQVDDRSLIEVVLSNKDLSEFFEDFDRLQEVKLQLQVSMDELRGIKGDTEKEKDELDIKKNEELDIKVSVERDKQQVEIKEAEKARLVAISQAEEASYEFVLAEQQERANAIRDALFQLRDAGAIPFGQALDFTNEASGKTGVDPALILAILQQESALGANVGTCNRPGDALTWKDIMPGPGESWRDDQAAFVRITNSLGIPQDGQPLSCPLASGGWGGAMGPSQFIPVTWESYASQIASTVGVSVADPWNPRHAIHATALYMRDLGGASSSYSAQLNAACRYYSGQACGQSSLPNTFYGEGVLSKASTIQVCQIDPVETGSVPPSWCS